MTRLSVNVNKLATLRNSRGKNNPDVLKMTLAIINYGAQGITVHPRPDGRHIRKDDVFSIAKNISVEFNIEGYPDPEYLALVEAVRPAQCTLVPDPPEVLTSNAGWALAQNEPFLREIIQKLKDWGIRTSLFIDPHDLSSAELDALERIKPDRVELYTEAYAEHYGSELHQDTLHKYVQAARQINQRNIGLNAGHDLNLQNLHTFITAIPTIEEVSIGHALICDALELGMKETVRRYLACLVS